MSLSSRSGGQTIDKFWPRPLGVQKGRDCESTTQQGTGPFIRSPHFTGRAIGPAGERQEGTGLVPGPQAPHPGQNPFLLPGFHVGGPIWSKCSVHDTVLDAGLGSELWSSLGNPGAALSLSACLQSKEVANEVN